MCAQKGPGRAQITSLWIRICGLGEINQAAVLSSCLFLYKIDGWIDLTILHFKFNTVGTLTFQPSLVFLLIWDNVSAVPTAAAFTLPALKDEELIKGHFC